MDNALITVFTPTYNRMKCIQCCYESLKRQCSNNFKWLIVDDGSTDQTRELIEKWKHEKNNFAIEYVYKENGGLHTAYNKAIEVADTELFMCIDSDDWLPDCAIEEIEHIWDSVKSKGYVGIMGIDRFADGKCVGDSFPDDVSEMFLYEKLNKYRINGDKKMVHRTELLKRVAPMPTFTNEKFFNPSYLMYELDQFGKLYVTNTCLCIVDYQQDGMSSNIYKQYRSSPRSFAETRKLYLSFPNSTFAFRYRHNIHYVSSCIIAKKFKNCIKESPTPFITAIAILPGILLTGLVLYRTRNTVQ